jgi:hypothetical protein
MVSLSCHPVLKQIWDSPNDKWGQAQQSFNSLH